MKNGECIYFGCWGGIGHYLWSPERKNIGWDNIPKGLPFRWTKLDGGFIPKSCRWKNGSATLTRLDGWTVLSFPDNSVDSRPASNSGYVIKGEFEFQDAVDIAKSCFPKIWQRYKFEVIEHV